MRTVRPALNPPELRVIADPPLINSAVHAHSSRHSHVEVTLVEPERRVTFRHRMIWKSTERIAEESYEISPDPNGVKVVQTINLTRAGIPWPFRLLIWFIHRFGWQTGEPDDQPLKRLVEQSVAKG